MQMLIQQHTKIMQTQHLDVCKYCVFIFFLVHITGNTGIQPMAHPQESYLAHGMSPQGSFSSPQTATQHSVLSKCSHVVLLIMNTRHWTLKISFYVPST